MSATAGTVTLAVSLVGVGTGAQWADSVMATEGIETGTAALKITSAKPVEGSDPVTVQVTPDRKSATFTVEPEDASFAFSQDLIITNVGTLPLKDVSFRVTGDGESPLVDSVLMRVNDAYDGNDPGIGSVSEVIGYENQAEYTLEPWESTLLWFDFYTPDRVPWLSEQPALPAGAQGQKMTVTMTFTAVDAPSGLAPQATPEQRND